MTAIRARHREIEKETGYCISHVFKILRSVKPGTSYRHIRKMTKAEIRAGFQEYSRRRAERTPPDKTKMVSASGETHSLREWAGRLEISLLALRGRAHLRGGDYVKAIDDSLCGMFRRGVVRRSDDRRLFNKKNGAKNAC